MCSMWMLEEKNSKQRLNSEKCEKHNAKDSCKKAHQSSILLSSENPNSNRAWGVLVVTTTITFTEHSPYQALFLELRMY